MKKEPKDLTGQDAEKKASAGDWYDRLCAWLLRGGRFLHMAGALMQKYRQLLLYVFFGALTTAVNLAVYYPLKFSLPDNRFGTVTANVAAWVAAVGFAFVTNKHYVFSDHRRRFRTVMTQLLSFASGRLLSLGAETVILLIGDAVLASAGAEAADSFAGYVPKLIAQVVVLLMNFIISKFFVFRRKEKNSGS